MQFPWCLMIHLIPNISDLMNLILKSIKSVVIRGEGVNLCFTWYKKLLQVLHQVTYMHHGVIIVVVILQ